MEKIIRKGNDLEEVLNEFYSETELTKDDIFYTSEVIKGKLLKKMIYMDLLKNILKN